MADPTFQSLCCLPTAEVIDSSIHRDLLLLHQESYYGVSLASAFFGFIGSVYQLSLRYRAPFPRYQYFNVGLRGNSILFWLALADSVAALGLMLRSALWFLSQAWSEETLTSPESPVPLNPIFCAFISGCIQFFYTSSHLWTLIYAVDVRRITYDQPFIAITYHVIAWGGAFTLCTIGLIFLYLPNPEMNVYLRLLPNYAANYLPLAIICIASPLLFISAFRQAEVSLMRRYARYTTTERRLIELLRIKFILIVSVFYVCWMPNIVNGMVLWISWPTVPLRWVLANWYLMVILNPLQGVFNILLYKIPRRRQPRSHLQNWLGISKARKSEPQEETPLLL